MKFDISHQDRSVIIALGSKLRNKQDNGLATPPMPLPDDNFLAKTSKEELIALLKMSAMNADEVNKTNDMLQTKLGLIISLLDGTADVRCVESPIGYARNIPLERAVKYTLNNWERIENIFRSAKTDLDNNRVKGS